MTGWIVTAKSRAQSSFDPDQYRMTIGEHLEELRWRLILALAGFAIVFVLCLLFARGYVMPAFCQPLISVLRSYDISPQVYFTQVSDPFMTYIKVSLVSAAAIASPWMLYQLWLFVAAGLYEHERRIVTRYVPLSLTLLICGLLFVYFLVLPWTLTFFMAFSLEIPLPSEYAPDMRVQTTQPTTIPAYEGDPANPVDGQIWLNKLDGRLKLSLGGHIRVLAFGPENLVAPIITLADYIDLVFGMLLTFGLSFQLPLVIMALVAAGIVERHALKAGRRYVYFVMVIIAAVITPGDVITATVALMFPLIGLYELGIWLSRTERSTIDADG
ncbi:twin-arginine translocase subunit TatC [Fontivita pretiosa]|uniref:twin-arginine translocase subunit TatC n=1 Tax=Fontivita pretiosa TaxID=2989684 RepID=UPI003D17853C